MTSLLKRGRADDTTTTTTSGLLDRVFDDWASTMPFWRSPGSARWMADDVIKVEEFQQDGVLVVRAELPGIDPERDVEVTVSDGMLHIEAERREEQRTEESGYVRRELRYGSFSRSLPMPQGASEADVSATYKDGILEIRMPVPAAPEKKKVAISRS